MQWDTETQLLVEILQERKKADGAVERDRGLADRMVGREDERPLPSRLAVPRTLVCRAPFLAFLIHQRFSDEEKPAVASGSGLWQWPLAVASCVRDVAIGWRAPLPAWTT